MLDTFYLLSREMSAYSYDTPMLLGVFTQKTLAEQAKQNYLEQIAKFDPFHDQAYFEVDLSKNIQIQQVDENFKSYLNDENSSIIYLVIATEEGFGQGFIDYIAIFDNQTHAECFVKNANQLEDESETSFPKYFEYLTLPLNQLLNWFIRNNQLSESLYFDQINQTTPKLFCHHALLTNDLHHLLDNTDEGDDGFYLDRNDAFLTPTKEHLILKNQHIEFARFKIDDWYAYDERESQSKLLLDVGFCLLIVFYQDIDDFNIEQWIDLSDDELKQHYLNQNVEQPEFEIFILNVA